jgi:hypothetical protein
MRFVALATDFDGTLAHDGRVDAPTVAALERCRASGRRLLLVTGRELDELLAIFPEIDLFDRVVAENGALLYSPADGTRRLLGDPPPETFVATLRERNVPLSVGGSIVATVQPHETAVLEAIRDLGLELKVVFNKGAVMVMPPAVNKASGLAVALDELGLSPRNTVAIGDGENDHALLEQAECGVAVANAVATLRSAADYASELDHGKAVVELVDALIEDDLAAWTTPGTRRALPLGRNASGEISVPAHDTRLLVAGSALPGKRLLVRSLLALLARHGYQSCVLDPAGRFGDLEGAIAIGSEERGPVVDETLAALEASDANVIVRLAALAESERMRFFQGLLSGLRALQGERGRPHWVVLDDAHHLLPRRAEIGTSARVELPNALLVTAHAEAMSPGALGAINAAVVMGENTHETLGAAGINVTERDGDVFRAPLADDEALVWRRAESHRVERVRLPLPEAAFSPPPPALVVADLPPEASFQFRGPDGSPHLRAQNLALFLHMAEGVDDRTWLFHLRRGDYSAWLRNAYADEALAAAVASVERSSAIGAAESRARIRRAIDECHLVAGQAEPASEAPKRIQCSSDSISASNP